MEEPLAVKLRPKKLSDIIGQKHLVGTNKVLTNLINNKKMFSIIFYGPPGTGKTSIASVIANELDIVSRQLNAVINNKKDFEIVFEETKIYKNIVLIVDEIHRLNKDKQDLLLPVIESGKIILIGLTTSNPYHKINPAIRSRCQIFELKPLSNDDINIGIKNAIKSEHLPNIKIRKPVIDYIVSLSSGDLRSAYNILEMAYFTTEDKNITLDVLKNINSKPIFVYDNNEDGHYDLLSAFQKSIRGSDVHAALHYLGRLIVSGDLDSIYRRMTVIAYEDIGLANPNMGVKVNACINACELVGMPEAKIPLSVMIIDLCLTPKSNSALEAIDRAISDIETKNCGEIPKYLKIPAFGYKFPHNYKDSYVPQQYLPDALEGSKYYNPKSNKYEEILKITLENIEKQKKIR